MSDPLSTDEVLFDDFTFNRYRCTVFRPLYYPLSDYKKVFDGYILSQQQGSRSDSTFFKPFPEIVFDFARNPYVNAFAGKSGGKYIIGIFEGVFIVLSNFFSLLMSHQDAFIHVGDASMESFSLDKKPLYAINSMFKLMEQRSFANPKDRVRGLYASYLADLAIHFLFHHELSHILFGHVDWCRTMGCNAISEVDVDASSNLLDRQTLEMDADCTGLGRTAGFFMRHAHPLIDGIPAEKLHFLYERDPYEVLSDLNTAVFCLFQLFEREDFRQVRLGHSLHPDPGLRQYLIAITFYAIGQQYDCDQRKLHDAIILKMRQCERAFELISGQTQQQLNEEVLNAYFKHFKKLEGNWKNRMRSELQPYAFKRLVD